MSYKKFTLIIFIVLVSFVLINLIIWETSTKNILTRIDSQTITGDMTRMGYLPDLNHERKNSIDLSKKHMNFYEYNVSKNIDMITIGDSFSNGISGGPNRFYQDYLSSYTNLNILNFQQLKNTRNYLETVVVLLNSGVLREKNVKYILIESTQRKVVTRFSIPINYKINFETGNIIRKNFNQVNTKPLQLPKVSFINDGNFKYLIYNLLYNFSANGYISKVYKERLSESLFSIGDGKDLLFYKSELKSISKNTLSNIEKVNNELNKLALVLKKEGITLIFMPAVVKFDLYRDFIVNKNIYPEDQFFNIFRKLKKSYLFIDTKEILVNELQKRTKDIFYIDDTHWSYKASNLIAKDINKKIK